MLSNSANADFRHWLSPVSDRVRRTLIGIARNALDPWCRVASVALAVTLALTACGTLQRRAPVPAALTERAVIPGIPNSRLWLDRDITQFIDMVIRELARERKARLKAGLSVNPMPPVQYLAISGGGEDGAFAAGVLAGWAASGSRPQFKVVSGVSAGALIAPFAFLGPDYDAIVRKVATSIGPGDVFRARNRVVGLLSDGMAGSEPLRRLVEHYVTRELLRKIAGEYARGRALQIATTDLDAGRQVTWNMGAIASSEAPKALELFRNVMIASASIPGVVSPVMIDVEANGKRYQEMHVDGGVISQLFTYPAYALAAFEKVTGTPLDRDIHVYLIRNARLDPEWAYVPRRTLNIGARALSVLVQAEGTGDVRRIYRIARQDGADYNLAYIGADFQSTDHRMFDKRYLKSLFDYGYQLAKSGAVWHKAPPGEDEPTR